MPEKLPSKQPPETPKPKPQEHAEKPTETEKKPAPEVEKKDQAQTESTQQSDIAPGPPVAEDKKRSTKEKSAKEANKSVVNIINEIFKIDLPEMERPPSSKAVLLEFNKNLQEDGISPDSHEGLTRLLSRLETINARSRTDEDFRQATDQLRSTLRFRAYNLFRSLEEQGKLFPDQAQEIRQYFSPEPGIGGGRQQAVLSDIEAYAPNKTIDYIEKLAGEAFHLAQLTGKVTGNARAWLEKNPHFRDAYIDRLLSLADQLPTTPSKETQDFYTPIIRNQILSILTESGQGKLARHWGEMFELREKMHDIAVVAEVGKPENLLNFSEQVMAEHYDLLFLKPGVATAVRCIERAFKEFRTRNKGQLPYEQIVFNHKTQSSELDEYARKLFRAINKRGILSRTNDLLETEKNVKLNQREEDRAFNMARGFILGSLRAQQHVAHATPPEEMFKYLKSFYTENIAKEINPARWKLLRFGIGSSEGHTTLVILGYPVDYKRLWFGLKSRFFFNKNDILRSLRQKPAKDALQRVIDIENLSQTGDFMTGSTWRIENILADMTPVQKQHTGLSMEITQADEAAEDTVKKRVQQEATRHGVFKGETLETERHWQAEKFKDHIRDEIKQEAAKRRKPALLRLAQRDPHQLMNLLAEEDPKLRKEILERGLGQNASNTKIVDEVIEDLIVLAEERTARRWTFDDLDFNLLDNPKDPNDQVAAARKQRAIDVARAARELIDPSVAPRETKKQAEQNLNLLAHKRYAYAPSFEDVPFEAIDFIKMGGRAMARKVSDHAEHIKGWQGIAELATKLPQMQDLRQVAAFVKEKIWEPFSHYNTYVAHDITGHLAEGLGYFFRQDARVNIPIFGWLYRLQGKNSLAQETYGKKAIAADEVGLNDFVEELFSIGGLTREQAKQIKDNIGASWINRGTWYIRWIILGFALAWLIGLIKEIFKPQRES